jgi:hypothetical protein
MPTKFPTYRGEALIVADHCVATPNGEAEFTVTTEGQYTPKNEKERQAVELLGATPGKGK